MELSIIIISYNTKDLTVACLRSLLATYKTEIDQKQFEVIIIDNASSDSSLEALKNIKVSGVKIIGNNKNLGFAKACNQASTEAKGRSLLFLNSDTKITDRGLLDMISFSFMHTQIGILGGRLQKKNGEIEKSAGQFYTVLPALAMLLGLERFGLVRSAPEKEEKVDWVSGGYFLIKKSVFYELKGFDERMFMYMEDMDLCFRAKKAGYTTYFYPKTTVIHEEHASSSRSFAIISIYQNLSYFYKKHYNYSAYILITTVMKIKAYFLQFFGTIIGNAALVQTYEKAFRVLR